MRDVQPPQTFATIQAAVHVAIAGDVIELSADTYFTRFDIVGKRSQSGRPITLRARPGQRAVISHAPRADRAQLRESRNMRSENLDLLGGRDGLRMRNLCDRTECGQTDANGVCIRER